MKPRKMIDMKVVDRPLYTYPDVDRILGATPGTAARWVNGYKRRGTSYLPVVRPEPSDGLVTWGEFIEVYYLYRFRGAKIPLQKLRHTLHGVRDRLDSHYLFSHDDVLYADQDRLEVIEQVQNGSGVGSFLVKRTGQTELTLHPEAKSRLERITYKEGTATALLPRPGIESIEVAGDRFFGKPRVSGRGIAPQALADLVWFGTPAATVIDQYGVTREVINDTGRFVYGDRWNGLREAV